MKMIRTAILAATLAFTAVTAATVAATAQAADVRASASVDLDGFFGRIDIGGLPPPVLVNSQAVVIRQPAHAARQPIYLRVPPEHARNWARNCHRYLACDQPVYFVQEGWYRDTYVPAHRRHVGPGRAMPVRVQPVQPVHGSRDHRFRPGPGAAHDSRPRSEPQAPHDRGPGPRH